MNNRIVAILHNDSTMAENTKHIVKIMLENSVASQVYVFTEKPDTSFNIANGTQICSNVNWPSTCTTVPQIRNWINRFFRTNNFAGKLHVLEDNTEILKIPTGFITDLENMMDAFEYDVWFSTTCDNCNYVYSKYNPRLAVMLDKVEYFKFNLGEKLVFTSHSNTQWIAYDFSRATDDQLRFDEDFTIAMFYIIEFLARRRNTKKPNQVYFMNQYLTVPSELGVFKAIPTAQPATDDEALRKEDEVFKAKKVNYAADNDIDIVLEAMYNMLNSKL